MNLQGKIALVTGGAHRVGKAITLALAREGASIVLHYGRSAEEAAATTAEIEALGGEVLAVQADLRSAEQIEAMFAAVRERFGRLDVLVNSAANFIKESFDAITVESWKDAIQVNLRAPFLCSQHAARLMRTVERPNPALIVNISDLMGVQPWRNFVQHGVSKAGLNHLTQVLAVELAPDIRVNAIVPGPILPPAWMDPQGAAWRKIYEAVPLRRPGHPDYIAQTVVFLAANDFITGAIIPVDGGGHLVGPRQE